jgi:hypothetical protein
VTAAMEVLLPSDVTAECLFTIFDAAFRTVAIDDDGDLVVTDDFAVFLLPRDDGRLLAMLSLFRFRPEAPDAARLDFANRVNDSAEFIRASVTDDEQLCLDFYIAVDGGLPAKTLVLAVRRFLRAVRGIGQLDWDDVLS